MALTVLKVGGSLSSEPKKLRSLMAELEALSKTKPLVVVPGGGQFADIVRKMDKQYLLDSHISHKMAILGMDQYGLLLSNLVSNPLIVRSFDEAEKAVFSGRLLIFLPSQAIFVDDPLENSWEVTSDSIALYIAHILGAENVLFITDVDGIYTANPKLDKTACLIREISPEELQAKKTRTSVDSALPQLLKKWPVTCTVVNGLYPERVKLLLEGKAAVASIIRGKKP